MHNLADLSVIYSPAAEAYFTSADRRILSGLRATLDMIGAPYPEYARRQPRHPLPGKTVIAAFHADNPQAAASARAADLERRKR